MSIAPKLIFLLIFSHGVSMTRLQTSPTSLIEQSCCVGFDAGQTSTTPFHAHPTCATSSGARQKTSNMRDSVCHAPNGHDRTPVTRLATRTPIPTAALNDARAPVHLFTRRKLVRAWKSCHVDTILLSRSMGRCGFFCFISFVISQDPDG